MAGFDRSKTTEVSQTSVVSYLGYSLASTCLAITNL
jgi:hypothetical protein